ncbi:hypothetical protein [Streptomyces tendae]
MNPADEIDAAVRKLSSGDVITRVTNLPLAKLLRETAALHEHDNRPDHGGCDWCGDEDWPCADIRNALAVARTINDTAP